MATDSGNSQPVIFVDRPSSICVCHPTCWTRLQRWMINKQHNIKIAVAEVEAGDAAGVVEETEEDVGVAGMVVEEEEMVEAEMEEDATEGVEGAEDEEEGLLRKAKLRSKCSSSRGHRKLQNKTLSIAIRTRASITKTWIYYNICKHREIYQNKLLSVHPI